MSLACFASVIEPGWREAIGEGQVEFTFCAGKKEFEIVENVEGRNTVALFLLLYSLFRVYP
jgi:hypothetical protein